MKTLANFALFFTISSSVAFSSAEPVITSEKSSTNKFMSISPNGKISVHYSRPDGESRLIFKDEANRKIIWEFACTPDSCTKKNYFDYFINLQAATVLKWSPDSSKLTVYNSNGFEEGNYVWMIDVVQKKLIKQFYSRFAWNSSYSGSWNPDSSQFGFLSIAYESTPRSALYRPESFSVDGTRSSLQGNVEFPDIYQEVADRGCGLTGNNSCYSWHWISPTQIEVSVFKPISKIDPTYTFKNLNFDFSKNTVSATDTAGGYMWKDFGSNFLGHGTTFNGFNGNNYYVYNRQTGTNTDVTIADNRILADVQPSSDVPFAWLMKRATDENGNEIDVQKVKFANIKGSVTSTYQIQNPPSSHVKIFLVPGTTCAVVSNPRTIDVVDTSTGQVLATETIGDVSGGALVKIGTYDGGILIEGRYKVFKISCK